MNKDVDNIDFTPPKAVQRAASKGLELKDAFGGKGLRQPTVEWARHLADGQPSNPAQARRMRAWFHRHRVDRRTGWDDPPTPGYVAWLLWGGDAGEAWAEELAEEVEAKGGSDQPLADAKHPPRKSRAKAGQTAGKKKSAKKRPSKKTASKKTVKKKVAGKKKVTRKKASSKKAARKSATKKKGRQR